MERVEELELLANRWQGLCVEQLFQSRCSAVIEIMEPGAAFAHFLRTGVRGLGFDKVSRDELSGDAMNCLIEIPCGRAHHSLEIAWLLVHATLAARCLSISVLPPRARDCVDPMAYSPLLLAASMAGARDLPLLIAGLLKLLDATQPPEEGSDNDLANRRLGPVVEPFIGARTPVAELLWPIVTAELLLRPTPLALQKAGCILEIALHADSSHLEAAKYWQPLWEGLSVLPPHG